MDFTDEVHISLIQASSEEETKGDRNIQKEILAATSLQAGNMDIGDFIKLQNEDQRTKCMSQLQPGHQEKREQLICAQICHQPKDSITS